VKRVRKNGAFRAGRFARSPTAFTHPDYLVGFACRFRLLIYLRITQQKSGKVSSTVRLAFRRLKIESFGLWRGNRALMVSCGALDLEGASTAIIQAPGPRCDSSPVSMMRAQPIIHLKRS
jgi:hypothetical protein